MVYHKITVGMVFTDLGLFLTEIKILKCQNTFPAIAGNMRSKKTGISPFDEKPSGIKSPISVSDQAGWFSWVKFFVTYKIKS